ncbi:tetratricopeptide repeat protein [Lysobacter sp. S4-A87]|uniref:tetratricopeptide repeat protein n=1 Tax=Lysobacter sp. S4-A87 TaxID=2925843 RepID=UPI001F5314B0|nr:tetratricopeptide repeat protein [Lysobacter sp. S4-A87]UNK48195.1 tetratricopeptide repeat protein [Lysobacter sp. S4-A87]
MLARSLLLTALLAATGAASAQSFPKPAEFYFAADANTVKPVVAVRETGDVAMQKLAKTVERNPHAKAEVAQLAHLAMDAGRVELGRQLYGRALGAIDRSDGLWRSVVWNYGWDLYRAGDSENALVQWRTLVESRSVTATWIPPTFALALWSVGRKDDAVQWYAAAVRSEPQQWNTPNQFARLLPDWRDDERATLAEVQAAWAANPPRWP